MIDDDVMIDGGEITPVAELAVPMMLPLDLPAPEHDEWLVATWMATKPFFHALSIRLPEVGPYVSVGALAPRGRNPVVPLSEVWRSDRQGYHHRVVPEGARFWDPVLFHRFRMAYPDREIPLVVELTAAHSGRAQDAARERRSELALQIELQWLLAWERVPDSQRPGLVLIDPDGATVIAPPLEPRLWPGLAALNCFAIVSSSSLETVERAFGRSAPSAPERSRTVKLLEKQHLLVPCPRDPLLRAPPAKSGNMEKAAGSGSEQALRPVHRPRCRLHQFGCSRSACLSTSHNRLLFAGSDARPYLAAYQYLPTLMDKSGTDLLPFRIRSHTSVDHEGSSTHIRRELILHAEV